MFENTIDNNIKEGEEVILVVRKYLWVFTGSILVDTLLIIAPFFFLYPLFRWQPWGVILFCVVLFMGVLLSIRTAYVYLNNIFIITDDRIIDIDQRGFFQRIVSETTYDKIQDVSYRHEGIAQTVLRFGSIIIQTAASQANIELQGVKNPQRVQQQIIELQREMTSDHGPKDTEHIVQALKRLTQDSGLPDKEEENENQE